VAALPVRVFDNKSSAVDTLSDDERKEVLLIPSRPQVAADSDDGKPVKLTTKIPYFRINRGSTTVP